MNTQNQNITQKRKKQKYERERQCMDRRRSHRKGKSKTSSVVGQRIEQRKWKRHDGKSSGYKSKTAPNDNR
jgi:hypothetical protein